MLNLFSLHGDYYQNNENRLTANFLFLLSELRSSFLPAFLNSIGITQFDSSKIEIVMQPPISIEQDRRVPDAFIWHGDDFQVVIEAKIGTNALDLEQLGAYAKYLGERGAGVKRLVAITQIEEGAIFETVRRSVEPSLLSMGSCVQVRWFRLLQILRNAVNLSSEHDRCLDRAVMHGRRVEYEKRLASMFLKEIEVTMFEKIIVDEVRAGQLGDVRLTTQTAWFMDVARRHRIWFPDGSLSHGLAPSRWVAFYEMADSPTSPSQITHIARNRIFWNRITFDDAANAQELDHVFADKPVRDVIRSWPKGEKGTFHIVLTDEPVRLAHPIPLAGSRRAKFLTKKIIGVDQLLSAATVDALFL